MGNKCNTLDARIEAGMDHLIKCCGAIKARPHGVGGASSMLATVSPLYGLAGYKSVVQGSLCFGGIDMSESESRMDFCRRLFRPWLVVDAAHLHCRAQLAGLGSTVDS